MKSSYCGEELIDITTTKKANRVLIQLAEDAFAGCSFKSAFWGASSQLDVICHELSISTASGCWGKSSSISCPLIFPRGHSAVCFYPRPSCRSVASIHRAVAWCLYVNRIVCCHHGDVELPEFEHRFICFSLQQLISLESPSLLVG